MTRGTRSFIRAVAALLTIAAATAAAAEVPGPERIEVVQTADGPRVLLAGVTGGTPFAEAAERLGGVGVVAEFFGSGPIFQQGEIDGLECSVMVTTADARGGDPDRVGDIVLVCEGGPFALRRLAGRFRAALAALPVQDGWYGTFPTGASVRIWPEKNTWWGKLFGAHELRVAIR